MLKVFNSLQRISRMSLRHVISKDGTRIAFEQSGKGPAIIMVVGAFNDRTTGKPLGQLLESHFTIFNYDRRGRGDSSDTLPYAVEREIEDLDALIQEAGGSAYVFGYSSGAVLAMRAAAQGLAITKLALYEPPLLIGTASEGESESKAAGHITNSNGQKIEVSDSHTLSPQSLAAQLAELIAEGRRGDAVELFQTKGVGIPMEIVAQMRNAPFRPALEKMAHTLVYEMTILGGMASPAEIIASVAVPTLLMAGAQSPAFLQDAVKSLVATLPNGEYRILEGQTHDIVPSVVAPLVEEFCALK
jgi:pimeloyl-ACP methyl ester carboxylesterase